MPSEPKVTTIEARIAAMKILAWARQNRDYVIDEQEVKSIQDYLGVISRSEETGKTREEIEADPGEYNRAVEFVPAGFWWVPRA